MKAIVKTYENFVTDAQVNDFTNRLIWKITPSTISSTSVACNGKQIVYINNQADIERSYRIDNPHYKIRFRIVFYFIDSWEDTKVNITVKKKQ